MFLAGLFTVFATHIVTFSSELSLSPIFFDGSPVYSPCTASLAYIDCWGGVHIQRHHWRGHQRSLALICLVRNIQINLKQQKQSKTFHLNESFMLTNPSKSSCWGEKRIFKVCSISKLCVIFHEVPCNTRLVLELSSSAVSPGLRRCWIEGGRNESGSSSDTMQAWVDTSQHTLDRRDLTTLHSLSCQLVELVVSLGSQSREWQGYLSDQSRNQINSQSDGELPTVNTGAQEGRWQNMRRVMSPLT